MIFFRLTNALPDDNDGYGGPSDHNCDVMYRPSLFYSNCCAPLDNDGYGGLSDLDCNAMYRSSFLPKNCAPSCY